MPLFEFPSLSYLRRERFYVDSFNPLNRTNGSRFDIIAPLPRRMQYIQGIEVSDVNLPNSLAPTFYAETVSSPGNNFLDLTLAKYEYSEPVVGALVAQENFTIEFEEVGQRFGGEGELALLLQTKLNAAFAASSNPEMVNAVSSVDADAPNLFISIDFTGETTTRIAAIAFLFGTGPNKDKSAWKLFGFSEGIDTPLRKPIIDISPLDPTAIIFDFASFGLRNPRIMQPNPLRYVDIRIDNISSSFGQKVPVSRVFLAGNRTIVSNGVYLPRYMRLLTTPLPYQDDFNVQLIMEDEVQPNPSAAETWNVTFDLLLIAPENCVPRWVKCILQF